MFLGPLGMGDSVQENDVCAMGAVLLVFFDEQGRMPSLFEELVSLGYLERESDGYCHVAQRLVGTNVEGWGTVGNYSVCHPESLVIKYGATEPAKDLIAPPDGVVGHSRTVGLRVSEELSLRMKKAGMATRQGAP